MSNIVTRTCPECDAGIEFEFEAPDYDVGLMGYSVFYCEDNAAHDPTCTWIFNQEAIAKMEHEVSTDLSDYSFMEL